MKSLSLLCLVLSFAQASAWFSFGNLLFSVGICKVPGPRCHVYCGGPLHPKKFCGCESSSGRRQLGEDTDACYDAAVCDDFEGSNYEQCIAHADYDSVNSDGSQADASEASVSGGHSGTPTNNSASRKLNWLPFAIAGAVLTMFIFVAVRIRRKKVR